VSAMDAQPQHPAILVRCAAEFLANSFVPAARRDQRTRRPINTVMGRILVQRHHHRRLQAANLPFAFVLNARRISVKRLRAALRSGVSFGFNSRSNSETWPRLEPHRDLPATPPFRRKPWPAWLDRESECGPGREALFVVLTIRRGLV